MAASNTFDCFRECIGLRVVGVLRDAMPVSDRGLAKGTKTLVFEDGTGLTMAPNGSYWRESSNEIDRAISVRKRELDALNRDVADVLATAGALEDA